MALTQSSVLPIPYPDGLVIGARQNPWQLMMKEDSPNIVQMSCQGKQTPLRVVIPNFDLIIVTTGYEHRLSLVKVDTANGAIMFLESINQCSHSVVP
jgi:hypothetical protein